MPLSGQWRQSHSVLHVLGNICEVCSVLLSASSHTLEAVHVEHPIAWQISSFESLLYLTALGIIRRDDAKILVAIVVGDEGNNHADFLDVLMN